jgi:hypothetical protein
VGDFAYRDIPSRAPYRGYLCGGGAGKSLLYFSNDFLPDVVFNDFRVAHAPKHPCVLGFGLFPEKLTELSPQIVNIIDFRHSAPFDEVGTRND